MQYKSTMRLMNIQMPIKKNFDMTIELFKKKNPTNLVKKTRGNIIILKL